MNVLIRFFVRRFVFAISIFAALVFFGLTAGSRLGVDLLPNFDFPIVAVVTSYPGASAEETAQLLSEPIEDALATLPDISSISSFSGEGFSSVIVQFNFGTSVNQAAVDTKQRTDTLVNILPEDASTPIIQKFDPADEPIMNIAVSAPGFDLREVQQLAEDLLEPPLQQVEGVADVTVVGSVEREIQVLLNPAKLERFNLSPQQVAGAITASSLNLPAGSLTLGDERILLTVRNNPTSTRELEQMIVDPVRGLKVNDVATVRDSAAKPSTFVRLNGEPVVMLEVRKVSGSNSVSTASNVRKALASISLPTGYDTTIIRDTTVFVATSVFDTMRETALAVLAVAFVVLLFVGRLGSTFSVVLAIPITLIGAVMVFGLLGFTFNTITLLAITVAVGLVVDDSIVISENVDRYRSLGYSAKEAVFQGAGEVSVAVLSSTLSLLAVFIPIAFLPGVVGQFFAQFGLSLAATIVFSYLEAMFFLTVRLAYLPDPLPASWRDLAKAPGKLPSDSRWAWQALRRPWLWLLSLASAVVLWRTVGLIYLPLLILLPLALLAFRYLGRLVLWFVGAILRSLFEFTDGLVARLREAYAKALGLALNHSNAMLVVAALLIGSLGVIFPMIPFNFVPDVDVGELAVTLELPPGSSLEKTDALTRLLEAELSRLPEAKTIQATAGAAGTVGIPSPERAAITIELIAKSQRVKDTNTLAAEMQPKLEQALAAFPEAEVQIASSDGGAIPVETGLEITLMSNDRVLLASRDRQARALLSQNPQLNNVSSSLEGTISERVFVLNPARLAGTGLTAADLAQTLRAYNVGIEAANLREGGNEIPINVKMDPLYIRDEQTLLSLPIYAPALQSFLPLEQLGGFEPQATAVSIDRANQAYTATITADLSPNAPGLLQVRREVEAELATQGITDERVRLGTGVGPDLLGDLALYGPIAFALAILLNYLVIASQFNSFKYPLYLLLTVPLALVGAFWIFLLTGNSLDVISVLGVVILIGLVTKNAILLLDVVVSQVEQSDNLKEALIKAGRLRLRPILMTAITILIISVPLLLGLGEGSEFRQPLGLVILGGVLSSTFLTLFVVPAAFYRFERKGYETRLAAVISETSATEKNTAVNSSAAEAVDWTGVTLKPDRS